MTKVKRRVVSAALVVALAGLGGCSWFGSSTPKPTTLQITVNGSGQLNLNSQSESAPVVIRFYQLASTDKFLAADFFALFDNASQTLGSDLIATKEYEVRPRQTLTYSDDKVGDGVQFIGVIAAFRDVANATWRATIPIKSNADNKFVASADLSIVTLAVPASPSWWKFF